MSGPTIIQGIAVGGSFEGSDVKVVINYCACHSLPENIPEILHKFPLPNPCYYGRSQTQKEIQERIEICRNAESLYDRILVLIGFGGMGKSELALVLAEENRSKFNYIFWLDAQTKSSLKRSFSDLASILKVKFENPADVSNIYRALENHYEDGIFILDNAEQLTAAGSNPALFGIEDYLDPNVRSKKPIFIVTSRNGANSWRKCTLQISKIPVDRLSDEESFECLLRYLQIPDQPLSRDLEKHLRSLALVLEGYPLALSLMGVLIYDKGEEISLEGFGSKVKVYLKLLEDETVGDLSGEAKYRSKIDAIIKSVTEKLRGMRNGEIALELLNIISSLPPDEIYGGLVNGIYTQTNFTVDRVQTLLVRPRFVWDDLGKSVKIGIKLLETHSLLKIYNRRSNVFGIDLEFDMIKIHRLLQQSVRHNLQLSGEFSKSIVTIGRFYEQNVYNYRFNVKAILEDLMKTEDPSSLETVDLVLALFWKSIHTFLQTPDILGELRAFLGKHELNDWQENLLILTEIFLPEIQSEIWEVDNWNGIQMALSNVLGGNNKTTYYVVKQFFTLLQNKRFKKIQPGLTLKNPQWLKPIADWVLNNWFQFEPPSSTRQIHLLGDIYSHDISRKCSTDGGAFILKLFGSTSEYHRHDLWWDLNQVYEPKGSGKRHPEEFLEDFFSCIGLELFIKTLDFSSQKPMLRFFRHYEKFFDVFKYVPHFPDFGKQLINSLEFTGTFRNFTIFALDVVRGEYRDVEKSWGPHYNKCAIYVLTSWYLLFNMDYNFYVRTLHGTILEENIEVWCEGLKTTSSREGRSYKINGALNILETFSEECKSHPRALKWAKILLLVSTD